MLKSLIIFAVLFFAAAGLAGAQTTSVDARTADPTQKPDDLGAPAAEAMRRAEIKRDEASHKEMVERADEAAQLGDDILSSYKKKNALAAEDLKKLERLDKLAHKIRSSAGGSDDEGLDDPPSKLDDAVKRLADASDELKKSAEKTSRLVVSGALIHHTNELIQLIKSIRGLGH